MDEDKSFISSLGDPATDIAAQVAVKAAGGMLDGIKHSGNDVWGGLVGDRIKLWRVNNFYIGLQKTARKLLNEGIPIEKAKALPYGEMLAIFDGMSKAEEDNLADLWANLLADAMSTRSATGLSKKSAAVILEQMSADVATVFVQLAKEWKMHELRKLHSRMNTAVILPLSEDEENLDFKKIKEEFRKIELEVKDGWDAILIEGRYSEDHIDLVKNELLRLNLIEANKDIHYFDPEPFSRGYQVNAKGLDKVLSDLQDSIYELVDSRTNHGGRALITVSGEYRLTNFCLNGLGRSFSKAVSLL